MTRLCELAEKYGSDKTAKFRHPYTPFYHELLLDRGVFVAGRKQLFVAMMKDGRCIQEEGNDDEYLWNRLWHKAVGGAGVEKGERGK